MCELLRNEIMKKILFLTTGYVLGFCSRIDFLGQRPLNYAIECENIFSRHTFEKKNYFKEGT